MSIQSLSINQIRKKNLHHYNSARQVYKTAMLELSMLDKYGAKDDNFSNMMYKCCITVIKSLKQSNSIAYYCAVRNYALQTESIGAKYQRAIINWEIANNQIFPL